MILTKISPLTKENFRNKYGERTLGKFDDLIYLDILKAVRKRGNQSHQKSRNGNQNYRWRLNPVKCGCRRQHDRRIAGDGARMQRARQDKDRCTQNDQLRWCRCRIGRDDRPYFRIAQGICPRQRPRSIEQSVSRLSGRLVPRDSILTIPHGTANPSKARFTKSEASG